MAGLICLQGGAEFGRACQDLDREVLAGTAPGPVVVLAAAAAPGPEYVAASRTAVRYYQRLSGDEVLAAPHPAEDAAGCVETLAVADLVVLPGGSPARLLATLTGDVAEVVRARHGDGATVSGASAGAMVLCEHVLLPDAAGRVAAGLGLVPGAALPHFDGRDRWADRFPAGTLRWGLPECGGVLLRDGRIRAAGAGVPAVLWDGQRRDLPRATPVTLSQLAADGG